MTPGWVRQSQCPLVSEPLQQPIDIIQLLARTFLLRAAPPQFFLDRLRPLPLAFLRHRDAGVVRGSPLIATQWIPSVWIGRPRRTRQRPATLTIGALPVRHHHPHGALRTVLVTLFAVFPLALLRALLPSHRLAHLPVALLQRGDRLLLRLTGIFVGTLVQTGAGVVHGLVGLAQTRRGFACQIGELLHQLTQRAPQSLLDPAIRFPLRRRIARRAWWIGRAGRVRRAGWILAGALLRMIQQAALPGDQVLHHALLTLATLALAVGLLSVI